MNRNGRRPRVSGEKSLAAELHEAGINIPRHHVNAPCAVRHHPGGQKAFQFSAYQIFRFQYFQGNIPLPVGHQHSGIFRIRHIENTL